MTPSLVVSFFPFSFNQPQKIIQIVQHEILALLQLWYNCTRNLCEFCSGDYSTLMNFFCSILRDTNDGVEASSFHHADNWDNRPLKKDLKNEKLSKQFSLVHLSPTMQALSCGKYDGESDAEADKEADDVPIEESGSK